MRDMREKNHLREGTCRWRFRRGIFPRVCVLLQLLERRTGLVGRKNAVWAEKCSDWVLTEILGFAHPFSRRAEIVHLQLN